MASSLDCGPCLVQNFLECSIYCRHCRRRDRWARVVSAAGRKRRWMDDFGVGEVRTPGVGCADYCCTVLYGTVMAPLSVPYD